MKTFFLLSLAFIFSKTSLYAQCEGYSSIPISHHHDSNICHGYAASRAYGKTAGDVYCDPVMTYVDFGQLAQEFDYVNDEDLEGIKPGDILSWGITHSAYVVYVPANFSKYKIGEIRVDQIPNTGGEEQKGVLVESLIYRHGHPVGYYIGNRGLKIRFTFLNSFQGGILKTQYKKSSDGPESNEQTMKDEDADFLAPPDGWMGEVEVNHGESLMFSYRDSLRIIAVDGQVHNGKTQHYKHWEKDGIYFTIENPAHDVVEGSTTFEAVFEAEIIVPDLSVSISGPTSLNSNEIGAFIAEPSGGNPPYIDYRWWERKDEGEPGPFKSDNTIMAPPPNTWVELTSFRGQQQINIGRSYDFSLKCEVTDSDNNTAADIHSINVGGGFAKAQGTNYDKIEIVAVPDQVELTGNYPNPFNPSTTIRFGLAEDGNAKITIYSINGQEVITLVNGYFSKGYHEIRWNGKNPSGRLVANGLYITELITGNHRLIKKMVFAK